MDLLIRGVVGLNHEVPQHCSQNHVHLNIGERGSDATPGFRRRMPPRPSAALCRRKRCGSKRSGFGNTSRVGVPRLATGDHHGCSRAESAIRRGSKCGAATWRPEKIDHGPVALQLKDGGLAEFVAAPVVLLYQLGEDVGDGGASVRTPNPASDAVVSCPAPNSVSNSSDTSPGRDIIGLSRRRIGLRSRSARDVGALIEARVRFRPCPISAKNDVGPKNCGGTRRAGPTGYVSPPCLNGGAGKVASREPSFAHGGMILRR